ncbi:MAG: GTP 3',8-cyclase MoaA [Candidatus Bathyarchaeota archaeon]|nr:GTP 3',8-cyclase MoaA [Candidatus Bathyarchaeota archaeon]
MVLKDNCGRPLLNLRISITQRCNLKCTYCHREGEVKRANVSAEKMTLPEIVRIAETAVSLGIYRIKLTGGEPLMRQDVCELVKAIAAIPGLSDLSMTTNGMLLDELAVPLRKAGLKRVNISLPTLNLETYSKLTGGKLENALVGVKAAIEAGFPLIKLNMVVLRGVNVDDVPEMINFARDMGVILQLIELDPINVSNDYYSKHHRFLTEQEAMLRDKAVKIETRRLMHNRLIYHLPDVTVEVVHPTENCDFCMHCTRMRVTSDGKLKPCLMRNDNLTDILTPMRNGATDEELKKLFLQANQLREPYNKPLQTQN